ncbi:hypothetical protein VYU27_007864 [Nannochloropsis oceanica]
MIRIITRVCMATAAVLLLAVPMEANYLRRVQMVATEEAVEGDKAPLSHGWAYGGPSGSRKEVIESAAAPEEGDKAPLSHGWAYGGASGSRKEVIESAAAPEEGDKAPLSRGWAYGGASGSRKEEVGTVAFP